MRCTGWRIDPQSLLNNGVQIHAVQQGFAIDSLDAGKGGADLVLQSCKGLAVVAKVVEDAGEESGRCDRAGHHDDVVVGCDFFGGCRGAFGVEDVVHEVFTVALYFEAATMTIVSTFSVCSRVEEWGKGLTLPCALLRTRRAGRAFFCCERVGTVRGKRIDQERRQQHA